MSNNNNNSSNNNNNRSDSGPARSRTSVRGDRGGDRNRFSYFIENGMRRAVAIVNVKNLSFVTRFSLVAGTGVFLLAVLRASLVDHQKARPLAKRNHVLERWTPITLVERTKEEGTKMEVFRFALPRSYDYAGYDPVSSVRLSTPKERYFGSVQRWFTPISHPRQRGIIEFAIRDADPGRFANRLHYLRPGDKMYLGRWLKEFPYRPNEYGHVALIASTAGASIALQLLNFIEKNPHDKTKLTIVYCNASAGAIPFTKQFGAYVASRPDQFKVHNVVQHVPKNARDSFHGFIGYLDNEILSAALPPPVVHRYVKEEGEGKRITTTAAGTTAKEEAALLQQQQQPQQPQEQQQPSVSPSSSLLSSSLTTSYRPKILVCGSQRMLQDICGRSFAFANRFYLQGGPLQYHGLLPDMGYIRSQVYKFGTSTHFMAWQ